MSKIEDQYVEEGPKKMTFHARKVQPVFRPSVRNLCRQRYPNHPKGCPNWGKRDTCPPYCKLFPETVNAVDHAVWFIWAEFNIGAHIRWMKERHPLWTPRQLSCCIYWQHTVRKELRRHSQECLSRYAAERPELQKDLMVWECPEAMGINVTATMLNIGVRLEWPPKKITRMVYMMGVAR